MTVDGVNGRPRFVDTPIGWPFASVTARRQSPQPGFTSPVQANHQRHRAASNGTLRHAR
jgi:hypothetical protein